jgi:hypothetical protein
VYVLAFIAYLVLAGASVWVLIWFSRSDEPKYASLLQYFVLSYSCSNYQRSSPWIFVLCAIRGTEYMTMIVISTDNSTIESIEALTGSWGYGQHDLLGFELTLNLASSCALLL